MLLQVRKGCDFFQDGKDYRGGDLVEVPEKYVAVLTLPGGRLQMPETRGAESPVVTGQAAMKAEDPDQAPLAQAGQTPARGRGRYNPRDLRPTD
jgi:hypothetical protein